MNNELHHWVNQDQPHGILIPRDKIWWWKLGWKFEDGQGFVVWNCWELKRWES